MTRRRGFLKSLISCAIVSQVNGEIAPVDSPIARYIAVPQKRWNEIWNHTHPINRYFDDQSPLGKMGWVSMISQTTGVFWVVCKDNGELYPKMKTDAAERRCSIEVEKLGTSYFFTTKYLKLK